MSSCRDLTRVCLQWNNASLSHCKGEKSQPRPLQPHGRSSPTAAPAPRESRAVEGRSVLHGWCSSKQKRSEEGGKVSCRRQIFLFVKYIFLFCIYHQHCHQLMETTGSLLPTAVALCMVFSLPDQQEKAITGAWPMSCGFRTVF